MKLSDINIRDPFIFADKKNKTYYMYASSSAPLKKGFCVYTSKDLILWQGPEAVFEAPDDFWATDDFWAPEVHEYNGRYYLFGTFSAKDKTRNSQILVSDSLKGPFKLHSGYIAPENWFALDATLYVDENKTPYAIFSHEWVQCADGEVCAVKLSDDLKKPAGKIKKLFSASQTGWAKSPEWNPKTTPIYVVDAPFVFKSGGREVLLWSTWADKKEDGYAVGAAYPQRGDVLCGNYAHKQLKLPNIDSGHPMVFEDFSGKTRICFHEKNSECKKERCAIYYLKIDKGELFVYEND